MVPEIDIWRSAQLLIKQHGKEVGLKADLRVSELTKKGDTTGADVWKLIRSAIEKLQNESPSDESLVPPIYLIRGASRTPTGPPALVMAPSSL